MKTSVYVAVAAIAAAAGFLTYRFAVQPQAALVAEAPVTTQPAAGPAPEEDGQIPAQLPDFTLGDLEGKPTSILSWPGKSMIVNFWATWCAPCRREIPLLRERFEAKVKIVVPGIRPAGSRQGDQKRTLTPAEAIARGADVLVIGRPITGAADPRAAALAIAADIDAALAA